MTITLSGVETHNKGAELMLYAILQEIERKYPHAIVYLPIDSVWQGLSYISTKLDIRYKPIQYIKDWCKRNHIVGIAMRFHIPIFSFLEDKYYVSNTNYLIDGSGFHYSDVWNHSEQMMETRRLLLKNHKKHGAKIILMPQAFGPLESKRIKEGVKEVNKYVDAVFCRDDISLQHLEKSHQIEMSKVYRYPDYTSLVKPVIPQRYKHLFGCVCVIPNCRLFDKSDFTYDEYFDFIKEVVAVSKKFKKKLYFLNHEGNDDSKISKQIVAQLKEPIEIVDNLNALEVKGMISTAYAVVSSRYHGLVSSLNSSVPCVATGWSHKYQELFKDYGVENGMINIRDTKRNREILQNLFNQENNDITRIALKKRVTSIQNRTKEMWQMIWSI